MNAASTQAQPATGNPAPPAIPNLPAERRLVQRVFDRCNEANPNTLRKSFENVIAGDFVHFSHPQLPNLESGTPGIYNRTMEVVDKQPNYTQGNMTYQLLDTGWMGAKVLSRIAPQGTPAWAAASSAERERYMFLSQDSTRSYSDGTAGKTVY